MSDLEWMLRPPPGHPGGELRFGTGEHVLGAADDADLRVLLPTVSRRHARLMCRDGAFTVEDLGSTNGTSIDGREIEGVETVPPGATLSFGHARFVVTRSDRAAAERCSSEVSVMSRAASMLLGPATVGFLRNVGEEVAFAPGEVVVRRGEKHDVFYVVISGEIELLLGGRDSRQRPLARLGAGAIFGAESVLANEGAAVDAVAVSDTRLLRYPASALASALQESASLRRKLLGGFARQIHETTADALDLLKGTEVIARLVQGDTDPDRMVAVSARMRAVAKKVDQAAAADGPVLVLGEDGTGRTLAARLIHSGSTRASGPLIAVNCRDLAPGHAAELILGDDLGGAFAGSAHSSGGLHLAHEGTLVLRGADELDPAVQKILASYLQRRRQQGAAFPNTRVVLTSRSAAESRGSQGLVPALAGCFDEVIELPPLVDRPKDILPLAESFVARHGPTAPRLGEDARHALLSLRYQRRHVAELREVIDLAVRVADGPEIRPEHIFGGVGEDVVPGVDITRIGLVRALLRRRGVLGLRAVTLVGFLAVIGLCLAFTSSRIGRFANAGIWSAWEPAVFALFLFVGPIWCTICPLSSAAVLTKKIWSRDRPPPGWIIRQGPWLAIVGFALIIWVEHVFHSVDNPLASAALLIGLILAAVAGALLWRREVWCRHLCPLGRLATAMATAAPVQLSAEQRVCASSCTTHSCYKGTPSIPGCPVFHHPLEGQQSYRCKLCLNCLRSCPHGSTHLQLRLPVAALWNVDAGAADLAMFAMAVSLLALGLVAVEMVPLLAEPLPFTLLCAGTIGAGIGLHHLLLRVAGSEARFVAIIRVAMVMMLLGWSALMASQLANVGLLAGARLVLPPAEWLPAWLPTDIGLLPLVQLLLILGTAVLASVAVEQIRVRGGERRGTWWWIGVGAVLVGYVGFLVYFVIG